MTPSLARKSSATLAFWKKPQKPKISESDILLPTEIWLCILDLIPEVALDSISRTSKRLRFIALPLFFRSQQIFPFQDTFAYRRISMSAHSELSPYGYQERSIQRLKFLGTTLISSAIRDFYVSPYPPGYNRRHRVEHKPVEAIMDHVVRILRHPMVAPGARGAHASESDELPPEAYFLLGAGNKDVVDRVEQLAKKYNKTMAQIALAWHMTKDGVTAPIVGTTSLEKLEDLIGALDVKLSAEDVKYLEEPYKPMKPMSYV
ncbi:NADP-dependent oxidoreductase domain-containing protein [Roridomyces roridus]|uniref:NADP-dependent oxidoreductase domain-containing protein n=1 Tax=Roridomyces roridus TaxID=1738132 RepID=A0AAD7CE14_9AGAR|nr:NADP-dependent oxidoreductase domain-containing protein [Roridomyces roridus]